MTFIFDTNLERLAKLKHPCIKAKLNSLLDFHFIKFPLKMVKQLRRGNPIIMIFYDNLNLTKKLVNCCFVHIDVSLTYCTSQ